MKCVWSSNGGRVVCGNKAVRFWIWHMSDGPRLIPRCPHHLFENRSTVRTEEISEQEAEVMRIHQS
jgi:hypothetical protein